MNSTSIIFSINCQVQNGANEKPKNMYFKPITKIIPHTPSSHILFVNCNTNNRSSSPTLDKKFLRLNDWKILMITYQHVLNGLILCAFVCNCFLKKIAEDTNGKIRKTVLIYIRESFIGSNLGTEFLPRILKKKLYLSFLYYLHDLQ